MKVSISNSQTFEGVVRLERHSRCGQLPADLKIPGDEVKVDLAKKNKLYQEMITGNHTNIR